jgi:hypothetical protein
MHQQGKAPPLSTDMTTSDTTTSVYALLFHKIVDTVMGEGTQSPHRRTPNPGFNPGFTPLFILHMWGGLRVKPGVWRPEMYAQVTLNTRAVSGSTVAH